jgi:hypothetical protein
MKTQEIQAEATLTPVLNQRHRLSRFAALAILFACTLLVSTARADTSAITQNRPISIT